MMANRFEKLNYIAIKFKFDRSFHQFFILLFVRCINNYVAKRLKDKNF